MKKAIRSIIILAVAITTTKSSMAQKGFRLNLNYNIASPLGSSFRDFVNKTSFISFGGSVLYGVTEHFTLGLQSSYTNFHRKILPDSENMVKSVPLLLKAEYSFLPKKRVNPFIGLGAGVDFLSFDQFQKSSRDPVDHTKAVFIGEAGVLIPFKKNGKYAIRLSSSYNLLPFKEANIRNIDSWNVQAGLIIPLGRR